MVRHTLIASLVALTTVAFTPPPERGVVFEIEVTLTGVMTHPYFNFTTSDRIIIIGGTVRSRVPEVGRLGGQLQFKGSDEELQVAMKRGFTARVRIDCDDLGDKEAPAKARPEGRRAWMDALVVWDDPSALHPVCSLG